MNKPRNTLRREQIANLAAQSLSNKEIGASLDISERLVKYYMSELFKECGFFGAGSRMKLLLLATGKPKL